MAEEQTANWIGRGAPSIIDIGNGMHGMSGVFEKAIEIKEKFNLSEELTQSAGQKGVSKYLEAGSYDGISEIKEKFNLSEESLHSEAEKFAILNLEEGRINSAVKIKEKFNLPEETLFPAAKEKIIGYLKLPWPEKVFEIKEKINLPEEFIQSTEFQSAARNGMHYQIAKGHIEEALKIKEALNLSFSSLDIFEAIPKMKELVIKMEKVSPEFAAQANKSVDILISLLPFKDEHEGLIKEIAESPFLTGAVAENPRFGSRLLIKFPKFDKTSKKNIDFLFVAKKEIMTANPEMEPESLEFRQAMQEKLQSFGNNRKIVWSMDKAGFNTQKWLNYDKTEYFKLESGGEHLAFSDVLSAPVERIKETIDSYAHCIKETLKEYRPELSVKKIPLGEDLELKGKINDLKEKISKAEASGDKAEMGKAIGMKKGLEALEKKIGQERTVVVWDKLIGEINSFQVLKDSLLASQNKLIEAEKKLEEVTTGKTPSSRMIQEIKQELSAAKDDLRAKFSVLESRIENFRGGLAETVGLALGEERSSALVQEVDLKVAEQFDHFETDRGTVANLFAEKSSSTKDKMADQPMSIFVWARNPDIDLYQGNYSPCCICVDSMHMGAESTIADYNTDLGVQIVNIWDEIKNEPVTAAWCWPAVEAGKKVLMVDNIESNTKFSANFPEQLTEKLFAYLGNYAKAIGADKVCLGKANNDLPVASEAAKLPNDGNEYKKLGGYNRPDGYFLEAEDVSVKIIRKKEVKQEIKKKENVEQVERILFSDINFSNLKKEEFSKLKRLESDIYEEDLVLGQAMIEDVEKSNGLEYSAIVNGKNSISGQEEAIGYLVAVEDETDEGDKSVYLEDFAIKPEARGQGLGFSLLKGLIEKLKVKAEKDGKAVLLDMHLREDSQRLIANKTEELKGLGAKIIEEALVSDYYDDNQDALYLVFEVGGKNDENVGDGRYDDEN